TVPAHFDLGYRPFFWEDEEHFDMVVYLDGQLLAHLAPGTISYEIKTTSADRFLMPGAHVIRVLEERHKRGRGATWHDHARVAPPVVTFELRPSQPARIVLRFQQLHLLRKGEGGPLTFTVTQGADVLAKADQAGGDPHAWPELCDEIEAGLAPGKEPSAALRRQLAGCVRWSGLWPGVTAVPPREKVRTELQGSR
ncbi:MAG: hypothetical protein M3O15_16665, partial [Acidobacteriota bacterium]|nr:hypothetical protein [Acidobacteriota bacterium]